MASRIRLLAAAALALVAVPALAQMGFSETFSFLKAVRERDGVKAQEILANPNSTVVNARDSSSGDTGLHIVARGRDINWLAFLLTKGARVDSQNNEGTTPLMLASQIGWQAGVEQLLVRRANPNLANNRGETPLILAVQGRHHPVVRLLLERGADPHHTDSLQGYSAIDYARQDRRSANILRILEEVRPR
jgi:uncharacterized protein